MSNFNSMVRTEGPTTNMEQMQGWERPVVKKPKSLILVWKDIGDMVIT